MVTCISHNLEETLQLGEAWGRGLAAPMLLGLAGDLGAGKTQLVRGLVRGVGSPARVHSPTFALLQEYAGGRFPVFHLDLYRLDSPAAVLDAGLESYLMRPPGVVVVEWIEKWCGSAQLPDLVRTLPPGLRIRLAHILFLDEETRQITYEDSGA